VEETSHNSVFSALLELSGRTSHRATEDRNHRTLFEVERAFGDDRRKRADKAGTFSRSRILWITVYGLMMLAFAWEAGFQFNVSPSTMNRLLAGALSVIGLLFCIKTIWQEL